MKRAILIILPVLVLNETISGRKEEDPSRRKVADHDTNIENDQTTKSKNDQSGLSG